MPLPASGVGMDDSSFTASLAAMNANSSSEQKIKIASQGLIGCDTCDFKFSSAFVINVGSKEYPKYRCRPCHASSRWYDRALESQGKKAGEMKQKNPAKYKLACVKFRVSVESDPPELKVASSCSDKTKRRDLAAEFFDSIEAESYTGAEERVQFCNEGQFVGYYMMFEAMKEAAAKALWQKSSPANSGFARRTNKQGQLTIAVELPSMAIRGKNNSHTRRLETKDVKGESEDEDEFQESSRKKFKLDVEDGQIDGLGIENPFRIGASVVVELVQSPMKLAPLTQDALARLDLVSASDAASSLGFGAGRFEREGMTDAIAGLTVVSARSRVKSITKKLHIAFIKKKTCHAQVLQAIIQKMSPTSSEVVDANADAQLKHHKTIYTKIESVAQSCGTWGADSYIGLYKDFMKLVGELQASDEELKATWASFKGVHNTTVKDNSTEARQLALKVRAVFKSLPLAPQGFPTTIISWFGTTVMGITHESEAINPKTSQSLITDPADDKITTSSPSRS